MALPWYMAFNALFALANSAILSGDAGGDLSGTYPDPTVIALQGNAVEDAAPADGDVLTWVAANDEWEPVAPTATGGSTVDFHSLTANTTITASLMPAPTNGLLVVILKQDATGTRLVTWDATDFSIAPTGLSTLPNVFSAVLFAAHLGKWMMVAPPMTGRT